MVPIDNVDFGTTAPFSVASCGCGCGCACVSDDTHSTSLAGEYWETANQNQYLSLAPFC